MGTEVMSTVDKCPGETPPKADGEEAACSRHFFWAACLLTLVSISFFIYIRVVVHKQENLQLIALQAEMDRLNSTLGSILKFDTFPVRAYCPQKKCQPCPTGWIQFQQKCYLFYDKDPPWKEWQQSQEICQSKAADLVIIDNLQEQEFVSNNTKYYYDNYHGYWVGLNQTADNNWVWVDGHNDTLGYWIRGALGNIGPCALMIPGRNFTANWNPTLCAMENKFICESEALIW
ncbi:dromaiocalcin-2-like [Channa argus]|uniref:dromaiocalcin-2-like n=1 Tax=Channa argus TaxID=215402 RepID=UPI003520E9CD